ncbi:hypothetical protein [Brevundimonas sp. Root1423]|uniref:hypothetical protein n=1 Tax=Brevundimonas sp. Root1423 TaxID=1736462 RepID=UPI0006F5BC3F|nr:hypothetical protein [Brevundimonas sp. Root1423]KQY85029.1 hypothetical protein ASD25_08545 [Brevundimonas sp. Root1423]
MTEARTFKYRTNLARKMSAPGGRSVADAVARADTGLEQHRAAAMAALVDRVAALEAACAAQGPGSERGVYDQAAALLDMAGFFDTGPLYAAAFSLCELSDRMIETGAWTWPSVAVHVRALRLILADDCRETEQAALILEGLSTILRRF